MSFLVSENDYDMVREQFYITVAFKHLMQDMSKIMSVILYCEFFS